MTLKEILSNAINPALELLPPQMTSPEAVVMLLSIGLQESRFKHRRQLVGNPPKPVGAAKSYWQAEKAGGMVRGLLRYHDSRVRDIANGLIMLRGVSLDEQSVWDAIEHDDVLAAGLARLLLWTDPHKLPKLGDDKAAWNCYIRTWRPGRPHASTWPALYAQALEAVRNEASS